MKCGKTSEKAYFCWNDCQCTAINICVGMRNKIKMMNDKNVSALVRRPISVGMLVNELYLISVLNEKQDT